MLARVPQLLRSAALGNYCAFFRHYKDLPPALAMAAEELCDDVRLAALRTMSVGYSCRDAAVPAAAVARWLGFRAGTATLITSSWTCGTPDCWRRSSVDPLSLPADLLVPSRDTFLLMVRPTHTRRGIHLTFVSFYSRLRAGAAADHATAGCSRCGIGCTERGIAFRRGAFKDPEGLLQWQYEHPLLTDESTAAILDAGLGSPAPPGDGQANALVAPR